jgi:predicted ester cyclase
MIATFSEVHVRLDGSIAEGDEIWTRRSFTAMHTGSGLGLAPTGKSIGVTGIVIMRVSDGKIVESWQN